MKQALDVLSVHPEHGGNAFTRAADELRKAINEQEKRHLCPDWDFMEITVEDPEFDACLCFPSEQKPSLWLAIAQDGRVKYTTDSSRALNWKRSGSYRLVRDYYTAPTKREWVGLTDEEIYDYANKFLYQHGSNYGIKSFGKAIEDKLKEKNT
jgi:hypothetical protein